MFQFRHGEHHMQCYGLLRNWEEKADLQGDGCLHMSLS